MPGGFDTPFEQTRVQLQQEEAEQAQNPATRKAQDAARRQFLKAKKKALDKVKKKVAQKIAQKLATRGIIRVVAVACGSTGVGLIVTYVIWTIQALAGNLMGSKLIPELELWELILWGLLGILLMIVLIVLMAVSAIGIVFSNPALGLLILGKVIFDAVMGS